MVVKLGDFEDKVNGEVVQVLYADHVKQFKKERGVWCDYLLRIHLTKSCPRASI